MDKRLDAITADDLRSYAIWRFTPSKDGKLWLKPLRAKKVRLASGHVVACELSMPGGDKLWGLIEGLYPDNPSFSQHWKKLRVLRRPGSWYEVARYHDLDWATHGPAALAKSLRRNTEDVFPLTFDVSHLAKDHSEVLVGAFEANPSGRLTRGEIIALAVPRPVS